MNTHKSQSGFTAIHILLLLVIVGIIGFTGWKVYSTGQTSKTAETSTATSAVEKDQPKPAASTVPAGFIAYQNKDLGFKFAYPKEWGDITIGDARLMPKANPDTQADKGKRWLLTFSNQKAASLGLTSKDWSTSVGRGGSCSIADGSAYKEIPTYKDEESDLAIQKVLAKTDKYTLLERASVGYCQNLAFYVDYIFRSNPSYLTLQFLYDAYEFKDENDFKNFKSSPDKYVKPELAKTIEQIAKTIQDN